MQIRFTSQRSSSTCCPSISGRKLRRKCCKPFLSLPNIGNCRAWRPDRKRCRRPGRSYTSAGRNPAGNKPSRLVGAGRRRGGVVGPSSSSSLSSSSASSSSSSSNTWRRSCSSCWSGLCRETDRCRRTCLCFSDTAAGKGVSLDKKRPLVGRRNRRLIDKRRLWSRSSSPGDAARGLADSTKGGRRQDIT